MMVISTQLVSSGGNRTNFIMQAPDEFYSSSEIHVMEAGDFPGKSWFSEQKVIEITEQIKKELRSQISENDHLREHIKKIEERYALFD